MRYLSSTSTPHILSGFFESLNTKTSLANFPKVNHETTDDQMSSREKLTLWCSNTMIVKHGILVTLGFRTSLVLVGVAMGLPVSKRQKDLFILFISCASTQEMGIRGGMVEETLESYVQEIPEIFTDRISSFRRPVSCDTVWPSTGAKGADVGRT